jgi:hypothetical protein
LVDYFDYNLFGRSLVNALITVSNKRQNKMPTPMPHAPHTIDHCNGNDRSLLPHSSCHCPIALLLLLLLLFLPQCYCNCDCCCPVADAPLPLLFIILELESGGNRNVVIFLLILIINNLGLIIGSIISGTQFCRASAASKSFDKFVLFLLLIRVGNWTFLRLMLKSMNGGL